MEKSKKIRPYRDRRQSGFGGASGIAALLHGFEILTGECVQYLDHEYKTVPAGTEAEEIISSNGEFVGDVVYVGHGEPSTMPRYLKDVREIICKGGLLPREMNEFSAHLVGVGLDSDEPVEVGDQLVDPGVITGGLLERAFAYHRPENIDHCSKIMKGEIEIRGAHTPEVLDAATIDGIFTELKPRDLTLEQLK